ncbi:MAG: O-antigen ligase family protein [Patescibacteria group bacterium]|jgi:O-antigen ligase/tetratricopeptide (TPR) repeat protein
MSQKAYLDILKGGILVSFVTLFFVFSSLLFPFISSKQIFFNIIIEILFVFWLFFIFKFPKYLPKVSLLSGGLIVYFVFIALSLVVSVDFNLSFWGDVERMLGYFHLLHFLIFYFLIITAFRSKKDFHLLLNTLVVSTVLIALYGIVKKTPESCIGNRAYVGGIMIFSIFLQAFFISRTKNWWLKLVYLIGIVLALVSFVRADISGAQLGLIFGILFSLFVFSIIYKNKKVKIIGWSSLAVFVSILVILFSFKSHPFFDNNYVGKSLRDFSKDNITLNTRLISYQAAGKYLVDHPINLVFGVGHGNYALIFDKYFNPKFYDYDRGATYFDRAHNNLIDILTTTGILGLLAYLSIFVFIVIYLLRAFKNSLQSSGYRGLNRVEFSIVAGLLVAYFVQNLAVFDSFATYLYFMVLLGYINFLGLEKSDEDGAKEIVDDIQNKKIFLILKKFVSPIIIVIVVLAFINNINSYTMLRKTIEAYKDHQQNGIFSAFKWYEEVFSYNTGLERDSRESYINSFLSSADQLYSGGNFSESEKIVLFAIELAEKNEEYNRYDNLTLYRLFKVYDVAGRFYFNNGDQDKGSYYSSLAFDTIDRAIESSPGRVPLYLNKSNVLLNFGKKEEAVEIIEYSKTLNPQMPEPYCQLSHFYFIFEDHEKFMENFRICGKLKGFRLMNWGDFLSSVEEYYYSKNDLDTLVEIYEIILESQKNKDVSILSKLALVLFDTGNLDKAEETARKILEIDEIYRDNVDSFLEKIRVAREK